MLPSYPRLIITSDTQALARAIYSRPDILLLDDVLSPIDYVTKKRILRQLFGEAGILHETSTTVVQVTQDRKCSQARVSVSTSPPNGDNTGAVAQLADVVLRLDETGVLQPYQFPSTQADTEDENDKEHDARSEKKRLQVSEGTPKPKSQPQEPKSKRPDITDRNVYATYFGSIGLLNLVLFIGGGIIFAFCFKFPGKSTHNPHNPNTPYLRFLLTCLPDVWVGWWTADSSQPDGSTHSIGYWFGIYAMLNVLPLIAVAGWVA